jgi:hypothetical protein
VGLAERRSRRRWISVSRNQSSQRLWQSGRHRALCLTYDEPKAYGRALGIPEYQLDFDTYDGEQV